MDFWEAEILTLKSITRVLLGGPAVENPPAMQEAPSLIPGLGRSPGEGKGYSSILAWRIPWTV